MRKLYKVDYSVYGESYLEVRADSDSEAKQMVQNKMERMLVNFPELNVTIDDVEESQAEFDKES